MDVSLPSNDTIGIVYNIQSYNFAKKQPHPISFNKELIRVDKIFYEYDQYGNHFFNNYTMLSNYPGSTGISDYPIASIKYNFTDYWKLIQSIGYYKDSNITISNFAWDGLTSFDYDKPNDFMNFNLSI